MSRAPVSKSRRASSWRPAPELIALGLAGLFIVYGTTIPFDFSVASDQVDDRAAAFFSKPLASASKTDLVSNVLLFLPWGALAAALCVKHGRTMPFAVAIATLSGLGLSLFVETLQLWAPTRTPSWIDLMTNTLGSLAGGLAGHTLALRVWPQISPRLRLFVGRRPIGACAVAAALGVGVAGIAPFDISLDVGRIKDAIKTARLIPFGPAIRGPAPQSSMAALADDAIVGALLGGLFVLALREGRQRQPVARLVLVAVAAVAVLMVMVELSQIVFAGHQVDATTVLVSTLGAALGAGLVATRPRITPGRWASIAVGAWCLGMLLSQWSPFRWSAQDAGKLSWRALVPFLPYYEQLGLGAVGDVTVQLLEFAALGALLAAGFRLGVRRSALVGLLVGLVLELGQIGLEGRTAEITDALMSAVGSAAGAWAWRRGATLAAARAAVQRAHGVRMPGASAL